MRNKNKQLNFEGQNIYVGMDVHKKQFTISIQGEHLFFKTFTQPPVPEILVEHLNLNYPGANYYAVYEAGFCGFWIQERLTHLGVNCIVVNPADIPTTDKEKKQKRDKSDSKKLARALKNNELEAIHVPDNSAQQDRALLRARLKLISDQTRCRNRIKSLLFYYGIELPETFSNCGTHWSKRFMDWLRQINLGQLTGNKALQLYIKEAETIRALVLEADKEIRQLSRTEKYKETSTLLLSVPGVGILTAMILLTELGDILRFKNLDHLCAYIGLVPNVYSSGEKERVGDITRRGNKRLKSHIIESSWVAVRKDPALSLAYGKLCSRMNGNKAIVRIARKLLSKMRYVLINKEKYKLAVAA